MMNGVTASPVVGSDGTAYLVTFDYIPGAVMPLTPTAPIPIANTFESTIIAVTPAGSTSSVKLKGIISRPAVLGSVLVATASLPDLTDYTVVGNFGNQSVLYVISVPFSSSTKPLALTMDGYFASEPVMAAKYIYVVTSDYGFAVMNGNPTFNNVFGNYNFNNSGTAKTYLYIFNLDGTLASKTTIQ